MLVFTFVLLTRRLDDLFLLFNLEDVSWGMIFKVIGLLLPFLITMTLPMGLLIACLTAFSRLNADREILILRTSGVSPWRAIQPLLLVGALCTVIVFYCTTQLVPWTYQEFRKVMYQVVVQVAEHLKENSFNKFGNDLIVFVNKADREQGTYQGITLYYSKMGYIDQVLTARTGQIKLDPDNDRAILTLKDGTYYKTDFKDLSHFYIGTFSQWVSTNEIGKFLISPQQGGKKRREFTMKELQQQIKENYGKAGNVFRVEYQERLAIPFACLVFALLGTSLGSIWRIKNRTLGFFLGVFFIGAYWILLVMGESLGIKGKIFPELSPWLPNIILGTLGIILTWRVCRQ